jgi:hypothetical protein
VLHVSAITQIIFVEAINLEALIIVGMYVASANKISTYRKVLSVNPPSTKILMAEHDLSFIPSLCALH